MCVNEATPIVFYDENFYDIVPIQMVIVFQLTTIDQDKEHLRSYILVHLGLEKKAQCVLVDSKANLNSLGSEIWKILGKTMLTESNTQVALFVGDYNTLERVASFRK